MISFAEKIRIKVIVRRIGGEEGQFHFGKEKKMR